MAKMRKLGVSAMVVLALASCGSRPSRILGSIAGTLVRVGGPAPGSALPLSGRVTAKNSAGLQFAATVTKSGRFVLSLPAGVYQLTGHSPMVHTNEVEMTCVALRPVHVKAGQATRGADVICSIS
jgi:hypothetical protein